MTRYGTSIAVAVMLILSVVSAVAHHSFAAEYDQNKPVSVKGSVNRVAWVNPHAYLYINVKDDKGKLTVWAFELLSPNALARQGWNNKSLVYGDEVTVDGYAARDGKLLADGSVHANSRMVTKTDGRKVYVGSSLDATPTPAGRVQ
jgi:hypothetical protein